ncbi:lipoprotein LpqH [Rhodococcus erythropolis]|uniref:lipoprotein LpqH n=1 Tax=Rhodococcus erythropolis TaxID=1833 RepID=UPI002949CFED|nr:lipoprotein LpqH [Rhodococcus erythropolis]MDV6274738.1 lipoprotein LpqH [Rhodococcus erythropolis]
MTKMVRTTMTRRSSTAFAATITAVALLASACGSDPDKTDSEKTAAGASSATSSVTVGEKAHDATFETKCAKDGDTTVMTLLDAENATYGTLTVSAIIDESGTVQTAGIAGSEGGSNGLPYTAGFAPGLPGGSASAKQDGNTFVVTGEGIGARDRSNPTETSSFEITFACESVIGG